MYHSDRPINSVAEDRLERSSFSKHLAKAILDLKTDETYTIGLFGKWGSGKTSLINMTVEEIIDLQNNNHEKPSMTIIKFDPWNFSNSDQLISQFFACLADEFRSLNDKDLSAISELMLNYANGIVLAECVPEHGLLISTIYTVVAKLSGTILKLLSKPQGVQRKKDLIVDQLKKKKHRILIVIDDIDRLPDEQIRLVFQLIASIAKFPYVTYLVAFDEAIVVKALSQVQGSDGEAYLEKIIQIPIQLPNARKSALRLMTAARLDEIAATYNIQTLEKRWQKIFFRHIDPLIQSVRDLNRLFNIINFKVTVMSAETDFTDTVALSAIEVFYPYVYMWIKENKGILTGKFDDKDLFELCKKEKEERENHIKEELQEIKRYKTERLDQILSFLYDLFPYFEQYVATGSVYDDRLDLCKNNSIGHPEKFDRYFDLDINNIRIKSVDIQSAIEFYDSARLQELMQQLDKENESFSFVDELRARIDELSLSRVEEVLHALIMVSSKLEGTVRGRIYQLDVRGRANNLIEELLKRIPNINRAQKLNDFITRADGAGLATFAMLIHTIESAYGRLVSNGAERVDAQLISLEELISIEQSFSDRAENVLREELLFDIPCWNWVFYLMKKFREGFLKDYLEKAFVDDISILKYLPSSTETWIGTENTYEIKDEYQSYLSQERIVSAIMRQKETGELFKLSLPNQRICAAFFLNAQESGANEGRISETIADALLRKWKANMAQAKSI